MKSLLSCSPDHKAVARAAERMKRTERRPSSGFAACTSPTSQCFSERCILKCNSARSVRLYAKRNSSLDSRDALIELSCLRAPLTVSSAHWTFLTTCKTYRPCSDAQRSVPPRIGKRFLRPFLPPFGFRSNRSDSERGLLECTHRRALLLLTAKARKRIARRECGPKLCPSAKGSRIRGNCGSSLSRMTDETDWKRMRTLTSMLEYSIIPDGLG